MHHAVIEAKNLLRKRGTKQAIELLQKSLAENPNDPNLNAQLGLAYMLLQNEHEALKLYPKTKGSELKTVLGTQLANYYFCREQLVRKLGSQDADALQALKTIEEKPEPNVGSKLSACLIVKNEASNLDRCLSSLKGICDEIVVVDTGSTDNTVEIAKKYGAIIGNFEWINDFAAARNHSLDLATGNWALWIDADEELTADSHSIIHEAIIRPQFGGYYIPIINLMDAKNEANQYVHMPVRLFRNIPEIRFEGRIHEQVLQAFDRHGFIAATLQKAKLLHYGYQHEAMVEKNKVERTISMLKREVEEFPEDPFHWFNLANVYLLNRQFEDCIFACEKSASFLTHHAPYAPVVFQIWSNALVSLQRPQEALQVADLAKQKGFFEVINQFELAHALNKVGRNKEALQAIDEVKNMPWPDELPGDKGVVGYKQVALRCQILVDLERYEEAAEAIEEVLAIDSGYAIAWFIKGKALSALDKPEEAAKSFEKAMTGAGLGDAALLAAAEWRKTGNLARSYELFANYFNEKPSRADVALAWIQVAGELNELEKLEYACQTIWEAGHQAAEIAVAWGNCLAARNEDEAARAKFQQAIDLDSKNANAHFCLGDLYYRNGLFVDALSSYEKGLSLKSDHAEGWFVLGNCFAQLGHSASAMKCYELTLSLNPEHNGAKQNAELVAA